MAMLRFHHRRSSLSREKACSRYSLAMPAANSRVKKLGTNLTPRCSVATLGVPTISRPRSHSLFIADQNADSLQVPGRARSMSLSGGDNAPLRSSTTITVMQPILTSSEEEHIFQCYARVMYMTLGILGAAILGLIFFTLSSTKMFNMY